MGSGLGSVYANRFVIYNTAMNPQAPAARQTNRRTTTTNGPAEVSAEQRRLARFHKAAVAALLPISPVFAILAAVHGEFGWAAIHAVATLVFAAALVLALRGFQLASKVLHSYGATAYLFGIWLTIPGALSIHQWWLVALVYAAAVFRGDELGWKLVAMITNAGLYFAALFALQFDTRLAPLPAGAAWPVMDVASDVGAVLALAFVVFFMSEQVRLTEAHLEQEHAKSEALLLNILPRPIAERLKEGGETIADGFPHVTVLFSDLVGFTPLSERVEPAALVAVLNRLFTGFDRIAERHGLEKIKTIGDAYMVASGVPVPIVRHAHRIAAMALEMRDFAQALGADYEPPLAIRIGIHSGPVVAGVIGESKFAYDLWGDTVNTASRMESSGVPGRIHVSAATHALLADDYEFEARGDIEIKGKGSMTTHFLVGPTPRPVA